MPSRPSMLRNPRLSRAFAARTDGWRTRNYIGILTSVNCSAHVAGLVADAFKRHPFTGFEPLQLLRRTLAGYARHPNFSHVIVLGLGCEVNQIGELLREHKLTDRIRNIDIQAWAAPGRRWRPAWPSSARCSPRPTRLAAKLPQRAS